MDDNTVAVTLRHDKKWHTYWKNPGDSGLPTRFTLERGREVIGLNELEWPAPKRYIEEGDILAYGYEGEQTFFFRPRPEDISGKSDFAITYLVCKDICIPGQFKTALGVSTGTIVVMGPSEFEVNESTLKKRLSELPKLAPISPQLNLTLASNSKQNALYLVASYEAKQGFDRDTLLKRNLIYPLPQKPFGYTRETIRYDKASNTLQAITKIEWDGDLMEPVLAFPKDRLSKAYNLEFIFRDPATGQYSKIQKEFTEVASTGLDILKQWHKLPELKFAQPPESGASQILWMLLMAFLGGLILNLMPCVLPVISLKLFGLIKYTQKSRMQILKHNMSYSLGVLATFWALAGVVLGLQASGESIGWGFQLQSPGFVAVMILVLFILSLNLFGLFEFSTPGGKTLGGVQLQDSFLGDFMGGVLATILSTPCSAPFLGTALTFAFSHGGFTIFGMFTAIGVGLATPFLLTAAFPAALKYFPKPGVWMEKLKAFLGLSLLLTIAWLFDVLVALVDSSSMTPFVASISLLFFAFFFYVKVSKSRILNLAVWTLALGLTIHTIYHMRPAPVGVAQASEFTSGNWKAWSPEKMQQLQRDKIPAFIDFTAKWCLTCKVNKKVVLETKHFQEMAKKNGLELLVGDWTKRDQVITDFLKQYGAYAVPAYFVIDKDGKIHYLGETVTTGKVAEFFN